MKNLREKKKKLQRQRMLKYFIEAAAEIIKEEGMDAITIRKVADKAGYNSATIYNYFENLDHLIFLASLQFITPYTKSLGNYISLDKNALDKNFAVWRSFFLHSFFSPKIYHAIFFSQRNRASADDMKQYYEIFPQDLSDTGDETMKFLLLPNIYNRTEVLLEQCVAEGLMRGEDVKELAELCVFLYHGMLDKALKTDEEKRNAEEMTERAMKYIRICYDGFLIKKIRQ